MSVAPLDFPILTRPTTHGPRLVVVPAPAVVAVSPRTEAAVRLTARGRLVVVVAALILLVGAMIAFGAATAATSAGSEIVSTTTVTVQPGQTLWSIAATASPHGDIRDTVDDIVRLNSLADGTSLQMGTRLAIPVYAN